MTIMKWLLLILFILGVAFLGWGRHIDHASNIVDDRLASLIPYGIGMALLVIDALLLVVLIIRAALRA